MKNKRTFIELLIDKGFVHTDANVIAKALVDVKLSSTDMVEVTNHRNGKKITLVIPSDLVGIKRLINLIDFVA